MTADQLQLITAAVDGELSAAEERGFRLLLATSAEARTLFAKLQADSERVRALPRVAPPAALQAKILARLATAAPPKPRAEPKRTPRPAAPRGAPAWAQLVLAASVFLCLATASFLYFTRGASPRDVARTNWTNVLPPSQQGAPVVPSPAAPRPDPSGLVQRDVAPVPTAPAPKPRDFQPDANAVAVAPEPRSLAPRDLIGFPLLKLPTIERVEVRLPFLRAVADLGREDMRQELLYELDREQTAFKFDLFVRDTARGVEVFQNAAKASGLPVLADAATLEKLKKKQAPVVVVYTESLTAAELVALFATLSAEDMKFSPRVCDSLHAAPVVRAEELELRALLGADVGLFKRIGAPAPGQGGDKGVSAGTIDTVVKAVNKGEKAAVLLTWQTTHPNIPRTNPATSTELTAFKNLLKRNPRKPDAVPAVIVIRSAG